MQTTQSKQEITIGSFVEDMSGIVGEVTGLGAEIATVRVKFGKNIYRDLLPHQLKIVTQPRTEYDHYIKQLQLENEELKIRLKWSEERVKLYQSLAQEIKESVFESINGSKESYQLSEIDQEIEAELTKK
jgi:hypothetical protein